MTEETEQQQRYCPRCGVETTERFCPDDGTTTLLRDFKGVGGGANFEAGEVVDGRYRVVGTIGRGGFGAVYAAVHTGTGQDIALKVMLADLAEVDRSAVRRFYKEAQVTAQLRHPNTVRVFDVGQTDSGALFIAMEFLRGPTLEDVLRDLGAQGTAMTERQALDIAIPVLRSLGEAHALELVHRDLKPANIILSEVLDDDPVVKVLDFGIARTADSSLTGQGTALGTPAFMSPEQCLGRVVDGRSDVYALGVILFRCLAGRVPFDDRNPLTIMYKHAHEVPPDLGEIAKSSVSEGFAACVMRALSKAPEDRFASAKDMRAALEAVREGTWRPQMDGQDATLTSAMRKAVARAEPAVPPGDTAPYAGESLAPGLDLLDAETAPASAKGAAGAQERETAQRSGVAAESAATVAADPISAETAIAPTAAPTVAAPTAAPTASAPSQTAEVAREVANKPMTAAQPDNNKRLLWLAIAIAAAGLGAIGFAFSGSQSNGTGPSARQQPGAGQGSAAGDESGGTGEGPRDEIDAGGQVDAGSAQAQDAAPLNLLDSGNSNPQAKDSKPRDRKANDDPDAGAWKPGDPLPETAPADLIDGPEAAKARSKKNRKKRARRRKKAKQAATAPSKPAPPPPPPVPVAKPKPPAPKAPRKAPKPPPPTRPIALD